MSTEHQSTAYFVPDQSRHPIWMALGMFLLVFGIGQWLNGGSALLSLIGAMVLAVVLYRWFSDQIREHGQGLAGPQLQRSYVWGMSWFIFSEVMFFAAFFGALFYVRALNVPWLAGEGAFTENSMLFPDFSAQWPLIINPDSAAFPSPQGIIHAFGIPLLNTILLVSSSITLTISHHGLIAGHRNKATIWLGLTIVLGVIFLGFQIAEYHHAYTELGLTLNSGIYGSTFFMLTGFHGAHVTIGTLMLIIMFFRMVKGHFLPDDHFGFQATVWYWHFVDVVWVCLFVLVYWI